MHLINVLLFISTFSKRSIVCKNFCIKNKLPVNIIRLDDKVSRDRASRSSFKITSVPYLVLFYEDGDISTYKDSNKILQVLKTLYELTQKSVEDIPTTDIEENVILEEEGGNEISFEQEEENDTKTLEVINTDGKMNIDYSKNINDGTININDALNQGKNFVDTMNSQSQKPF